MTRHRIGVFRASPTVMPNGVPMPKFGIGPKMPLSSGVLKPLSNWNKEGQLASIWLLFGIFVASFEILVRLGLDSFQKKKMAATKTFQLKPSAS